MTHPIRQTIHTHTQEILASVCGVLKATHMDMLVPTVQHRRIDAGAPITEHCAGRTQGFLKWVTWAFYLRHMHEPLNYMEKVNMDTINTTLNEIVVSVWPLNNIPLVI